MKKFKEIILVFILFFLTTEVNAQEETPDKVKALFLYNFIEQTDWPNEDSFLEYSLCVLNSSEELKLHLTKIAELKLVKGKPIRVSFINDISSRKAANVFFINTVSLNPVYKINEVFLLSSNSATRCQMLHLMLISYPDLSRLVQARVRSGYESITECNVYHLLLLSTYITLTISPAAAVINMNCASIS